MKYKLVCFDFDHTLTRELSAAEHASSFLGCQEDMACAEQEFRSGKLTTQQFTDRFAGVFSGHTTGDVAAHMHHIPLVSEIAEIVTWIKSQGARVVINTVGFRDLIVPLGAQFGFEAVSGVRLCTRDGRFDGGVEAYFKLEDKIAFASHEASNVGGSLSEVIAIGDGLSDVPLFQSVGRSIAFNASPDVNAMADASAAGGSCNALMPALQSFFSEGVR
ncbi:MAG: HAD-IB family phosphatase [Pseudomonadota bacterium]